MTAYMLALSAGLQLAVAVVAVRAPRSPRTRAAWWTLAAAMGLSSARRLVDLANHLGGPTPPFPRGVGEALSLSVSALLVFGVLRMRRLWEDSEKALEEAERREGARTENDELWRRVFEFAPDGYILLEMDGRMVTMNLAAVEISGLNRDSSEGHYLFDLGILDNDGLAQAARNLAMLSNGEAPDPAEYTLHRSDGTERLVEIGGYIMEISGRSVMLTIVHDISRRLRIESELRRSRLRLEEAQRVAGVVTFEIDMKNGTMLLSNNQAAGSDGPTQMSLQDGFTFMHEDDRERVVREMASAMAKGGEREIAVEYRQRDVVRDREATVRTMAHAEADADGNVVRLIGATLDLTDIRHAEQEIRTLNTALEERVRARTAELERAVDELEAFSYSVSHDLRSPLRAMAGYSDMVLEEDGDHLSETSREHHARIRASSVRMAGLIDGLLSLSRLTRATRNDKVVDLTGIAHGIVAELRISDPSRDVETVIEESVTTVADSGMMSLVLQNLLANAWKFTRQSPKARIEFGRDEHGAFFVRDNGVGFDASQSSKLFKPFERLHRNDEFEGTGIGLATVGRIVRHHGGKVWAEGAINKGSTFHFTLSPQEEAPKP